MKTHRLLVFCCLFGFLAACTPTPAEVVYKLETVFVTPRTTLVSASTPSPRPTSTATFTPTPTATALPIGINGNPRGVLLFDPLPQFNAPCGWVDLLDYPLEPPDGRGATLRQEFGNYRDRYDKFHAGEDWWLASGSNFGEPVFSIGHGQVTYAEPEGWGADKGVVIIQHIFQDGGKILSFYGHLDPPSVTLQAGVCVRRGDQIGQIGRPRTPPHLHFEMRRHMPISPGPGYWASDPTTAGWVAPSQLIWQNRVQTARGVTWARPEEGSQAQAIGSLDDGTFVALAPRALIGLDSQDGSLLWTAPLTSTSTQATMDVDQQTVYSLDRLGTLQAYSGDRAAFQPVWQIDLGERGVLAMLPLSSGGVLAQVGDWTFGVTRAGEIQWKVEGLAPVVRGLHVNEQLYFSTSEGIWRVGVRTPPEVVEAGVSGPLAYRSGNLFILSSMGIRVLDVDSSQGALLHPLPPVTGEPGEMLALPDGGLLLARAERSGSRLVYFSQAGEQLWQRSFDDLPRGEIRLVLLNGQVYMLAQGTSDGGSDIALYKVDLEAISLSKIFEIRTTGRFSAALWITVLDDDLLLFNAVGGMVALDPTIAFEAVRNLP